VMVMVMLKNPQLAVGLDKWIPLGANTCILRFQ